MLRLRNSLAWRLTIWFLLLSFFPIAVMLVFVRHTVADAFLNLAGEETHQQARLVAAQFSGLDDQGALTVVLSAMGDGKHAAFVVDRDGRYMAHTIPAKIGTSSFEDYSARTAQRFLSGGEGVLSDERSERLIGYAEARGKDAVAVVVMDRSLLTDLIGDMERSSSLQLGASMLVISIVGGVAIWILIGPMQALTKAARAIGAGDLEARIDPSTMDGELQSLATAFNQMTAQLRESRDTLERRVEGRTRELAALNAISKAVNDSLDLHENAGDALDQTMALTAMEAGWAYRLDEESGVPILIAHRGVSDEFVRQVSRLLRENDGGLATPDLSQPVIREVASYPPGDASTALQSEGLRVVLAVPLVSKGRHVGGIHLAGREEYAVPPGDLALLAAIGQQVGLAVENAMLYERAEESAAAAERTRLARDLHDSVTQTLFSASLIAEVLPRLWDRHPEEARRRLDELRQLTRGALAEMRTLLLELRPSAIVDGDLGALLRQLGEATTGRARIPVTAVSEGTPVPLPADVRVAIYRIVQEALNNVAKHSRATKAEVALRWDGERVAVVIEDDGCGFDPAGVSADHLGVGIITERAQSIGAELTVQSEPGCGTRISVVWTPPPAAG